MWSKGAVVIKKHGDQKIADAIADGMTLQLVSADEFEDMKRENFFLKKKNEASIQKAIDDAQLQYGYNWVPPKWANKLVGGIALIVYGFSIFVDKCRKLIIRDW